MDLRAFGPVTCGGHFGSVGAAWIFTNEPWLKDRQIVSFGKIRTSYALTGNDQIGDYQYYNAYKPSTINYQSGLSLSPASLYNPNYQWETTRKLEAAIELGLMDNRISLAVNYYHNRSTNQLIEYRLPATTGFRYVLKNFEARNENTGWEFMLTMDSFTQGQFKWIT